MGKRGEFSPKRNGGYIKDLGNNRLPALQVVWEVRWSLYGFTISFSFYLSARRINIYKISLSSGGMEICTTLEKRKYSFSVKRDFVQLIVISFLAFAIPFVFPHPQILTGIVVNALLVFAALGMRGNSVIPVILLPSIGAVANGLLFGPLTIFLIYLIPFIWIGNFLLVYGIKHFAEMGFWKAGIVSSVLKAGAIFLPAYGLYLTGVIPEILLIPMGILQIGTALGGIALIGVGKRIMKK